jgi:hypothetical protein
MNANAKKSMIKIALLLFPAIFSYANDASAANGVPFSQVQNRDWNLAQVKSGSATVIIDRTNVQREIYSIRFTGDRIRGRGADNLYSASYTAGENNSLSIRRIAGTLMYPIFEIASFRENEYFRRLERAYRWEFHDWRLELYTHDENGAEVVLEFIPIYK